MKDVCTFMRNGVVVGNLDIVESRAPLLAGTTCRARARYLPGCARVVLHSGGLELMYTKQSTANPNGFRPWSSRLGYYRRSSFPLPTTSLSGVTLPNFATFARSRNNWTSRDTRNAPIPQIYTPPEISASRRANRGLGMVNDTEFALWRGGLNPVLSANGAPKVSPLGPNNAPTYGIMASADPSTGGYQLTPSPLNPQPILQQNSFQPIAPAAITPLGDSVAATGTVQISSGGQTITVSSSPTVQPAPGGVQNAISLWLDQQMIPNVPNKYLALGAGLLLLMRKR